jgi:hypothetical protein
MQHVKTFVGPVSQTLTRTFGAPVLFLTYTHPQKRRIGSMWILHKFCTMHCMTKMLWKHCLVTLHPRKWRLRTIWTFEVTIQVPLQQAKVHLGTVNTTIITGKGILIRGTGGPYSYETSRLHIFWTIYSEKAVKLSALRTGRTLTTLKISGTYFC